MKLPLHKRVLSDALLTFARRYATLREDQRYYWQKSLAVSHRAYLMLGMRLHRQELFASPNDIFYATASEVALYFQGRLSGQDLANVVQGRQEDWRRYRAEFIASPSNAYPAFLLGDTPFEAGIRSPADEWQGRGISPGHARGMVRVILDANDLFRVKAGDILVAPATDPGWTPVFSRLAALVVERGGVLAHGAIIAREHQLPAVAGISNITRELADGDWIEVDGTLGTVRRIDV